LRRGACTTKVDFDKSKSIPRKARDDLAELKIQASRLGVKNRFFTHFAPENPPQRILAKGASPIKALNRTIQGFN